MRLTVTAMINVNYSESQTLAVLLCSAVHNIMMYRTQRTDRPSLIDV